MYTHQLNILIEAGADFVLPFIIYDDDNNPVDLTGCTVHAQLREHENDINYYDFTTTHNNEGGKIVISMPHETTAQIGYSYGKYDVRVVTKTGAVFPIVGDAKIRPGVTKSFDGTGLYIVGIESFEDLPAVGNINRLYYVYDDHNIYRWNGQNYVAAFGGGITNIAFKQHVNAFVDRYTITYGDGLTFDYDVVSNGITSVQKIGSSGSDDTGIVDTYRMNFYNGTHFDYTIRNGKKGDPGDAYDYDTFGELAFLDRDIFGDLAWLDTIDYKTMVSNRPPTPSEIMDSILSIYPCIPYAVLLAVYITDHTLYTESDFASYSASNSGLVLTDLTDQVDFEFMTDNKALVITPDATCPMEIMDRKIAAALTNSPALGGMPTAPTQVFGDDSDKIATTAFVQNAVANSAQFQIGETMDTLLAVYPNIPYAIPLAIYIAEKVLYTNSDIADYDSSGVILTDDTDIAEFVYDAIENGLIVTPNISTPDAAEWGNIGGTLADQTDLKNALDAKADSADLGTMAAVDDAPNDSVSYLRYNNGWARTTNSFYSRDNINTIICPAFSTETAYAIGDYVIYSAKLYRFTTAHPAGAWNASHVTQVKTMDEIKRHDELLNNMPYIATANTSNAAYHNATPRKKDITAYLTNGSLWDRISGSNGYSLFEDLFVGDYLTAGGQDYQIVDFDYYLNTGNAHVLTDHHLVMMPVAGMSIPENTALYKTSESATQEYLEFINDENASEYAGSSISVTKDEDSTHFKWNAIMAAPNTRSTAGGYKYSRMRQTIMKAADTIAINAFGVSHVKPIDVYYPNPADISAAGITNSSGWFQGTDWSDDRRMSICDLPNEMQIYGTLIAGVRMSEAMVDDLQFSLFKHDRASINFRETYWLRNIPNEGYASAVGGIGTIGWESSENALLIRPRFVLVG